VLIEDFLGSWALNLIQFIRLTVLNGNCPQSLQLYFSCLVGHYW